MSDWYEDAEGDLMPASPNAWEDLAYAGEEYYAAHVPGWSGMTEEEQELIIERWDGRGLLSRADVHAMLTMEWEYAVAYLDHASQSVNWCVDDLLLLGEPKYGEDWIIQHIDDLALSKAPETKKQCWWVASRYPLVNRIYLPPPVRKSECLRNLGAAEQRLNERGLLTDLVETQSENCAALSKPPRERLQ
jgi:hypothetical protein